MPRTTRSGRSTRSTTTAAPARRSRRRTRASAEEESTTPDVTGANLDMDVEVESVKENVTTQVPRSVEECPPALVEQRVGSDVEMAMEVRENVSEEMEIQTDEETSSAIEDDVEVKHAAERAAAHETDDADVDIDSEEVRNMVKDVMEDSPAMATASVPASDGASAVIEDAREPARLMISNLTLENFKSYAGRKQIGPFHKCFSAVVGPNGSGKSNVIDSLLFVFGSRTKKLRLNKLSELIHSSENFPDLTKTTVEVTFQYIRDVPGDPDAYEPVEGSEFRIARTAHKNNTSNYYINGKKATWKDVREKLMECDVDLSNNRFLILQGEVEQISLMKPKGLTEHEDGLLEYIEDIIGTSKYIEPINESYAAIEVLNEEYAAKLNRSKAVLKDKAGLEDSKAEAEAYLDTERRILDTKAQMFQLESNAMSVSVATLTDKRDAAREALESARESMSSQVAELKEMEARSAALEKEQEKIAEQLAITKAEFAKFEQAKTKLQQEKKHLSTKASKAKSARDKDSAKKAELDRSLVNMEEDKARFEAQVEELTARQEHEEKELERIQNEVQKKTQNLRDEVEAKKTELLPKRKVVADLEQELQLAQRELDMLEKAQNESAQQLEDALKARADATAFIKDSIKVNEKRIAKLEAVIPELSARSEELQERENYLKAKITDARMRREEANAMQQQASSSSKLHSALLAYGKKHPKLSVRGRLGDLGTIDNRYDVAISTACGALDNIVVDTEADAKICVQYLKEHRLGRATFIMLDKVSGNRARFSQKFQAPENAPRLFDLVQPVSDDVRPAFYYALRDTVVAKDIDQATRIAYGKHPLRVVSLEGAVIDQSGTMSGGGSRVQKGGMRGSAKVCERLRQRRVIRDTVLITLEASETISPKELAALEKTITISMSELADVRQENERVSSELDSVTAELETLKGETEKLAMELDAKEEEVAELAKHIPALQKKASHKDTTHDRRIQELRSIISEQQEPLQVAREELAIVEGEMDAIQQKIMKAGGNKVKAQRTCVDDVVSDLDRASKEVTRIDVQMKASQKQLKKLTKSIEKAEETLANAAEELGRIKEEKEELGKGAKELIQRHDDAQVEFDEKKEELEVFRSSYGKLKKTVGKLESAEVDLANKFDTAERDLSEASEKLESCARQLENFQKKKESFVLDPADETQTKLVLLSEEELETTSIRELKKQLAQAEAHLETMRPNMAAIEQYKRKEEEYQQRLLEVEEVAKRREDQRAACDALRKKRFDEFMKGFSMINTKLKQMYRMITLGGDAELEFVDSLDPFSEGLVFSVRPPKKSWKNIANLSGGEKTLSSLSLVFALHHYKPTPLYFMDEIDAALDFKNVSIVAHYIKERTKNAQFIIISLRHNMFDLADRLVGIYKTQNCTKSVTVNPRDHSMAPK